MTTSQSKRDRALAGQRRPQQSSGASASPGRSGPADPVPLTPAWVQGVYGDARAWLQHRDNWNVLYAMVALACFGAVIVESVVDGIPDNPLFWVITPLRLIIFFGVVLVAVRGGPLVFRSPINLPILGIMLAATGSVVLAQGSSSAWRGVVTSVAVFYLTVGLRRILPPRAGLLPYVVLFVFMVVTSWEAIGQTVSGENTGHCRVPWSPGQDSCDAAGAWHRAVGTFTNPNLLSAFLLAVIPIAFFVAAQVREGYMRAVAMACAASGVVALLCTVSRNAAISVVAGAVAYVVLRVYDQRWVRIAAITGAVLVVAANLTAWMGLPVPGLGNRADAYQAGIRLFLANPLGLGLEGAGPALQAALPDEVPYKHVHNMWLNWLMETSLLGFVSWVALPVLVYRYLARQARDGDVAAPVLAASLTAIMVNNMWDHPSATNRLEYLMWAVLALCISTTPEATAEMTGHGADHAEVGDSGGERAAVAVSHRGGRPVQLPGQQGPGRRRAARQERQPVAVSRDEAEPAVAEQTAAMDGTQPAWQDDSATRPINAVDQSASGQAAYRDVAGVAAEPPTAAVPVVRPGTGPSEEVRQATGKLPRRHEQEEPQVRQVMGRTGQVGAGLGDAQGAPTGAGYAEDSSHEAAAFGRGAADAGTRAMPVAAAGETGPQPQRPQRSGREAPEVGMPDPEAPHSGRLPAEEQVAAPVQVPKYGHHGHDPYSEFTTGVGQLHGRDPYAGSTNASRAQHGVVGRYGDGRFDPSDDATYGDGGYGTGQPGHGGPEGRYRPLQAASGYWADAGLPADGGVPTDGGYGVDAEAAGYAGVGHSGASTNPADAVPRGWHDPARGAADVVGPPTSLWSVATNSANDLRDYEPQPYTDVEPGPTGAGRHTQGWAAGASTTAPGVSEPHYEESYFTNSTAVVEPGPVGPGQASSGQHSGARGLGLEPPVAQGPPAEQPVVDAPLTDLGQQSRRARRHRRGAHRVDKPPGEPDADFKVGAQPGQAPEEQLTGVARRGRQAPVRDEVVDVTVAEGMAWPHRPRRGR